MLDTVEQRVLFEDTVFVEIAESVIVSVAKEDKVGDIVPETLVVVLTEKLGESVLAVLAETVSV